jgi:hypothetical protein
MPIKPGTVDAPGKTVEVFGPSAYYWKTYPVVVTASGKRLVWGVIRPGRSFVILSEPGRADWARIALNTYTCFFSLPDGCLGLIGRVNEEITLECFHAADLEEFEIRSLPSQGKHTGVTHFASAKPAISTHFSADLGGGAMRHDFPSEMREIREILIPVGYSHFDAGSPAAAIFSLRPATSEIRVYPQYWFTAATMDIGYQSITRVRRDARTGRIRGDGIRLGPFVLAEDDCTLEPGHRFGSPRSFGG